MGRKGKFKKEEMELIKMTEGDGEEKAVLEND